MRPEILNRLILAKALYKQGRNLCSAKNDRFKFAMGLISFHDAIDQVLGAIAEEVNLLGVGRNRYLIQLFNKLENYDSQKPLLYGQQVRNLNTLRNNIKHQGIFPNPKTEAYLSIAIGNFLEDTCRKYFNIDFNSLSLAELIRDSKIKQEVLEAERLLEEEDYKSALEKMAIAMFFTFERSIVSEARSVRTMMEAKGYKANSKLDEHVFPKFDPTRHTIKLLEKGVDPYLYHRFKNLTPKIGEDESTKELKIEWDKWYGHRGNWNRENCLFCFDFLIDAILKFQGEEYQGYQMIAYSDLFVDMIEAKDDVVVKVYNSKGPSLEETFELKRGQTLEGFVCDYSESDKSVLVFSASLPFSHIGVIEKSKVKITSIEKK